MAANKLVQPVLKWVGGKRQLLSEITKYIPKNFTKYYEPFLGGGALLFHLQPKNASVSDANSELINTYTVIRDNIDGLIEHLKKHKNQSDYYYSIRDLDRDHGTYDSLSDVEKASRIIFLNKTCYNGLFRVNNSGEFNSPFGKYTNPNIVNEVVLRAVSNFLNTKKTKILCVDFEECVRSAQRGSFVYFDPPYDPVSSSANFTGYSKGGFGRDEQLRLKNICDELTSRGVHFLLSNSATDFIEKAYSNYTITRVSASRRINSKASARGDVAELLIRNYE